ncbi:hypothetical protein J6590_036744 [Homalodisca vitripennis]|nr:hypothetical protein J6590_036744 [Homalodisca vitripennis]
MTGEELNHTKIHITSHQFSLQLRYFRLPSISVSVRVTIHFLTYNIYLLLIDLRASRLTRSCNLFFGRSHPTNYIMHGPLPRLHRLGNQLCRQFDFFEDSQSAIRGFFQSQVPR